MFLKTLIKPKWIPLYESQKQDPIRIRVFDEIGNTCYDSWENKQFIEHLFYCRHHTESLYVWTYSVLLMTLWSWYYSYPILWLWKLRLRKVMKFPQGRTMIHSTFWSLQHCALCRASQTKTYGRPGQASDLAHLQSTCRMYLEERLSSENKPTKSTDG